MRGRTGTSVWIGLALAAALASGCSCEGAIDGTADGGGGGERDASGGMDSSADVDGGEDMDSGEVPADDAEVPDPGDGDVVRVDGGFLLPDGAVVACLPAPCAGRIRQCGDCIDNDGDGLVDADDPGCIGACDNSEDVYDLRIPGGDTATCQRDCYYDDDQGSGNDGCSYDQRCDPLSPDPERCPHTPPGGSVRCPDTQPDRCYRNCLPLVPNGCDCFGCCELPSGSGEWVFLGSPDGSGARTCSPENIADRTVCRPCTPYPGCINTCERCELCIGRTELPPDCFPPPPVDGGVPVDDAGRPIDAGPRPDGGTPDLRCAPGVQACGLPTDPPCPGGYYCLTGCCVYFG